jgi:hypothetical protein
MIPTRTNSSTSNLLDHTWTTTYPELLRLDSYLTRRQMLVQSAVSKVSVCLNKVSHSFDIQHQP